MNKRAASDHKKASRTNSAARSKASSQGPSPLKDLKIRNDQQAADRIKGGGVRDHSL